MIQVNMIQVPFRIYSQILSLSRIDISQTSIHLANAVNNGYNLRSLGQINVHLPTLESINLRYTEKQITEIESDVVQYNIGQRLPHVSTYFHSHSSYSQFVLINKYFSGDLSGIIGESIFVYYLILVLGILPYHIAHLRPYKRRNFLSPDFVIYDQYMKISNAFSSIFGRLQYVNPVYAEVKGSMGEITHDRIEKALNQLSRVVRYGNQLGILFILNRPNMNRYVATLVLMRG